MVATEALRAHFATGQQPGEERGYDQAAPAAPAHPGVRSNVAMPSGTW